MADLAVDIHRPTRAPMSVPAPWRQNPRKLYAAYVDRGAPSFDKLTASESMRWTVVALAAAGLDISRTDPAFKALADQLLKGPGGVPLGQSDLYNLLRLWGLMSTASRGQPPDTTPAALVFALGHLAGLGVDCLLGALEQPGDRPIASALMHSIGAAAVAGFGLAGAQVGPASLRAVEQTLMRIAACYDVLEDGDGPRREGKMLRSAAWNVGALV